MHVQKAEAVAKGPSASPKVRFKKAAAQKSNSDLSGAKEESDQLRSKLQKAESIAESRLTEIKEYGEQREALLRELMSLRRDREAMTEDRILNSQHYLMLRNSCQSLQTEMKVVQESLSNKLKLSNDALVNAQSELQIVRQAQADHAAASKEEIAHYQAQLMALQKELNRSQAPLADSKAPEDKEAGWSKLATTQQSQLTALRQSVDSLRTESSASKSSVSDLQGKVAALTAQITEKEHQFAKIEKEYQTLTE